MSGLTEKEQLTLENIKRADVSYREGRNDTFKRKEEYEKWHTPQGLKKLHNEVKKDLPTLYPYIDKKHLEETGKIELTKEGKEKFQGDKREIMSKATQLLIQELQKAKKLPIGTVNSKGYKKVAEGKWVKPTKENKPKTEEEPKKEKPEGKEKPKKKKTDNSESKEVLRSALKKMATILVYFL